MRRLEPLCVDQYLLLLLLLQAFVRSVLSGLLQMQQGPSAQDLSNKVEDLLLKVIPPLLFALRIKIAY